MSTWIVTGASGSLATECINELLDHGKSVIAYSRAPIDDSRIAFNQVQSYSSLEFDTRDCEGILIAQGAFEFSLLRSSSKSDIQNMLEANFLSQIEVVHSFLKKIDMDQKVNVVILGSTNAYDAGKGTVLYGACKAGMLAFVKALNNEYSDTDIRFSLFSTGTLDNKMGGKVPNQDPTSLLDVSLVAREIVRAFTSESNLWQPEITIRRRHIRLKN